MIKILILISLLLCACDANVFMYGDRYLINVWLPNDDIELTYECNEYRIVGDTLYTYGSEFNTKTYLPDGYRMSVIESLD